MPALGNAATITFDLYARRFSYTAANLLEYEGRAVIGMGPAAAKWQIRKFTYTSSLPTLIEWADGNHEFDNVWNDRTTLVYK